MFDDKIDLETIQTVGLNTAGAIGVHGGTNVHELNENGYRRSGDTNGSGARAFIKFDTVHGDSDIRVIVWDSEGRAQEIDDISAVSISVGGGQECETFTGGIMTLAKLFADLNCSAPNGHRLQEQIATARNTRINHTAFPDPDANNYALD